jgi:nitrogen regulatory protein PII
VYGLVTPCREQAKVLAARLSGADPKTMYTGSNTSTTLKVMGVDLTVLGNKEPTDEKDGVVTYSDPQRGVYKKVILREGRIAGAILLGDTGIANTLLRAFHKGETVAQNPQELLFPAGAAHKSPASQDPQDPVVDEPLKEVIAVIRPESWIKTRLRVEELGIETFTQHRVVGRGRQRGLHFLARRGAASGTGFRYLPKRMASWIVPTSQVQALVEAIIDSNWTGQIGDGKIFVMTIDGTVQIGTDERNGNLQANDPALANA